MAWWPEPDACTVQHIFNTTVSTFIHYIRTNQNHPLKYSYKEHPLEVENVDIYLPIFLQQNILSRHWRFLKSELKRISNTELSTELHLQYESQALLELMGASYASKSSRADATIHKRPAELRSLPVLGPACCAHCENFQQYYFATLNINRYWISCHSWTLVGQMCSKKAVQIKIILNYWVCL